MCGIVSTVNHSDEVVHDMLLQIEHRGRDNREIFESGNVHLGHNRLSINEEKIGYCLIDVFENYQTIFIAGKGNKFNKNIILYQLREMTGLTTKEIRLSLKRYKLIYSVLAEEFRNQ